MNLKSLKLTAAVPAPVADAKERARIKLIHYLDEQKAAAMAQIAGQPFEATKRVTRTNEAGDKVRVDAPRHVRRGWFADAAGTIFFQIRYGSKPLELGKGVNAVEVGKLDALPAIIDTLIGAVRAGELDTQLAAASTERKANFKKRAKAA